MTNVKNLIELIPLDKLKEHPDNPNRMSGGNFAKLVYNIRQSGWYEPLVVRPGPDGGDCFQIINGHHRKKALAKLGYESANCVVWDINDQQTDVFLMSLNRLGGSDMLAKKLALLKRLNEKMKSSELAKVLPQSKTEIEKLASLKMPAKLADQEVSFAEPMVFLLDSRQRVIVENAISLAQGEGKEKTKAGRKAAALTEMSRCFLKSSG